MLYTLIVLVSLAAALLSVAAFLLVVHSIRREDRQRTLSFGSRGALSSGTRRMLGLHGIHNNCVLFPEQACKTCQMINDELAV